MTRFTSKGVGNGEQPRHLRLRQMRGAGADAVPPRRHHHVLRAAPSVELVLLRLGDDDGGGGPCDELGVGAERGEGAEALPLPAHDQPIGLAVLAAPGHARGLQDAAQGLVRQRPVHEEALVPLVHDGAIGVHGRASKADGCGLRTRSSARPPCRARAADCAASSAR